MKPSRSFCWAPPKSSRAELRSASSTRRWRRSFSARGSSRGVSSCGADRPRLSSYLVILGFGCKERDEKGERREGEGKFLVCGRCGERQCLALLPKERLFQLFPAQSGREALLMVKQISM